MNTHVIIATHRRPDDVKYLLSVLAEQTVLPVSVTIIGSVDEDFSVLDRPREDWKERRLECAVSGLTAKRNLGLSLILGAERSAQECALFFDDDFRPHAGWIEECQEAFSRRADVIGITGRVLADGVASKVPISEAEAHELLESADPVGEESHWEEVTSLYGCNMAVRLSALKGASFAEELPLYGWLEDVDFSGQIARIGGLLRVNACLGVHLGTRTGRVSGVAHGYSQIVNPIFIQRRGNIARTECLRLLLRAIVANTSFWLLRKGVKYKVDYRGRLKGNLLALRELATGTASTERILALQ